MEGSWGRRSRCRSERRRLYFCYIMGPRAQGGGGLRFMRIVRRNCRTKSNSSSRQECSFSSISILSACSRNQYSLRSSPFIRLLCSLEYVRYDKPRTMEVPKPHPTPPDSGVSLCSPHYHYLHCRHTLDHSVFFAASSSSSLP